MIRFLVSAALSSVISGSAWAADLAVTVTTPDGKPLANAVVTLPAPAGAPKPAFSWKLEVAQKDKTFAPYVLIAPVGAEVVFPNLDRFRHHVYSFSKGNKFELELYGKEEKRSVRMKVAGTAALGCNIHDEMVAFIRVVDTPWAAKTDETGKVILKDIPGGATQLIVWHPEAKSKDQIVTVALPAGGAPAAISAVVAVAAKTHH